VNAREHEPFPTEADALALLDELRRMRQVAKGAEQTILDEIKGVLQVAGTQPFDRSKLIEHSGLSRRTAYQVLPVKPSDESPGDRNRR
jgi:hypothetical protein